MVEKFIGRPYCYKILPLVYDDSISYYEFLCKILKKINEIIDELTALRNEFEAFKAYVTSEIARLDTLISELDERLTELEDDYNEFKTFVNSEIERLDDKIDTLDEYTRNAITRIDNSITILTNNYNQLATRVDDLQTALNNMKISGEYDSATQGVTLRLSTIV